MELSIPEGITDTHVVRPTMTRQGISDLVAEARRVANMYVRDYAPEITEALPPTKPKDPVNLDETKPIQIPPTAPGSARGNSGFLQKLRSLASSRDPTTLKTTAIPLTILVGDTIWHGLLAGVLVVVCVIGIGILAYGIYWLHERWTGRKD